MSNISKFRPCLVLKLVSSAYLVFDLEAGQFKFLEWSKMSCPPLTPSYKV